MWQELPATFSISQFDGNRLWRAKVAANLLGRFGEGLRRHAHDSAGSTGRRNTGVKSLCWGFKLQGLTWSFVEQTRQTKELASQSRMVLEQVRNQTRTAVASAWVSNEGAKVALTAAEFEVRAADIALRGVRREAAGGQRTTIDVLNAQQELTNARSRQIAAQPDRVIASYALLSAVGRLDVHNLSIDTPDYLPDAHYHQVQDAWHGLRTPSGQ